MYKRQYIHNPWSTLYHVFGLAVSSAPKEFVDPCSSPGGSVNCLNMKREEINFFLVLYYTYYANYTYYFIGHSSPLDIGIPGISQTQGSFCFVQLFGAGSHQMQRSPTGLLQSISCQTLPRQSSLGHGYYKAARYR